MLLPPRPASEWLHSEQKNMCGHVISEAEAFPAQQSEHQIESFAEMLQHVLGKMKKSPPSQSIITCHKSMSQKLTKHESYTEHNVPDMEDLEKQNPAAGAVPSVTFIRVSRACCSSCCACCTAVRLSRRAVSSRSTAGSAAVVDGCTACVSLLAGDWRPEGRIAHHKVDGGQQFLSSFHQLNDLQEVEWHQ